MFSEVLVFGEISNSASHSVPVPGLISCPPMILSLIKISP